MTTERDLDPFLDAALAEAERPASRPPPAFAAVLARAHSLAPDAVPPPAAAPVLTALPSAHASQDMPFATGTSDQHSGALAPFLAAARAEADADVAARLRHAPPPLPRQRPRLLPLAFAAAAALLLAVLGAGALGRLAVPTFGVLTGAQADATVRGEPIERRSQPRPPEDPRPAAADAPPPTPVPGDMPLATPSSAAPTPPEGPALPAVETYLRGHAPQASLPAAPRPRPAADLVAAELARLDDEAEALLLAGALDEADARYQQMIAIGGRRSAVEHAYADRWLLARRTGADARQLPIFRAYLKKFPRGRFADDATAGLCRLAAAAERPACWRDYLREFPGGAFRREAEEAAAP